MTDLGSAYQQFWRWKQQGLWMPDIAFAVDGHTEVTTYRHFCLVVGRPFNDEWGDFFRKAILSEAETEIVDNFLGPNGYAYYRMKLAKLEIVP